MPSSRIEIETTHSGQFRVVEFFPNGFIVLATCTDRESADRLATAYKAEVAS